MPGSSNLGLIGSKPSAKTAAPAPLPVALTITPAEQDIPTQLLRRWNLAMSLFHTILVIVTFSIGRVELQVPIYKSALDFRLRDEANPEAGWDLVPEYLAAGNLPLTVLVASFFALSAVFHFLNATLLRDLYERELRLCRTPTRWIEYFFSAGIMQLLIAVTLGVRGRAELLAITVLVSVTMPFGWWTEQIARPKSGDEWEAGLGERLTPWLLGHVPQVTSWFLVVWQFYDGSADTTDRIPWFVHLILWGELALFFSFGFVQLAAQCMPPRRYWQGELAFQVLSLGAKGLLGLVLLTNVLMLSRFEEIYEDAA
jgi:hypothetical protein